MWPWCKCKKPTIVVGSEWVKKDRPSWDTERYLVAAYEPGWVGVRYSKEAGGFYEGIHNWEEDLWRRIRKPAAEILREGEE